jgi:ectoine hydroxylase-related dioxygenase (phytanoyl-CoA dioxygenase family)
MSLAAFATRPEDARASYLERGFHVEPDVWTPAQCDALAHPRILDVMRRLLGPQVSAIQSQLFFCPPGTPGFARHQDNFYVQAPTDGFASAWTALDDVDRENGGLAVWPGTHRLPLLPVQDVAHHRLHPAQNPNANRRACVVPPGYTPLAVTAPRGAVVFLHGHLVHHSFDNVSRDRFRRALLQTYVRSGVPFRAGADAGRVEVPL